MLLSKFDPFKSFGEIEKNFISFPINQSEGINGFVPIVNTREGEYAFHIDVDLPGVNKEDIKIDIDNNVLTISGERKTKNEVKEEDYHKVETTFGRFSRSFTLPDSIDKENIEAISNDGVLEVIMPKRKEIEDRKTIKIK